MVRPGMACGAIGWIIDQKITCDGAIAQLGERYNGIVEVSGSIPLSSTNRFKKNPLEGGFLHF